MVFFFFFSSLFISLLYLLLFFTSLLYFILFILFTIGLYHGRDIKTGNIISHSHHKTKRRWYPNSISKKVWSESLNDWVRFNMTTAALKGIDFEGGIDNYIMNLDERSVQVSFILFICYDNNLIYYNNRIQIILQK